MSTLEILINARKRISDPANWTTYQFAKDAAGNDVPPESKHAVCWCAGGALIAETDTRFAVELALHELNKVSVGKYGYGFGVALVNDKHGHKAVLDVFDAAIVNLQAVAA